MALTKTMMELHPKAGGRIRQRLQNPLALQTPANYNIHAHFTVETRDHEDHTFNGIMFDVVVKSILPVEYIDITAVWVRGMLGPMTVWTCEGSHEGKHEMPQAWSKRFDSEVASSPHVLVPLTLSSVITVKKGHRIGIYVHSARPDDEGLVYDDQRSLVTTQDRFIRVEPGQVAYICIQVYVKVSIHGYKCTFDLSLFIPLFIL